MPQDTTGCRTCQSVIRKQAKIGTILTPVRPKFCRLLTYVFLPLPVYPLQRPKRTIHQKNSCALWVTSVSCPQPKEEPIGEEVFTLKAISLTRITVPFFVAMAVIIPYVAVSSAATQQTGHVSQTQTIEKANSLYDSGLRSLALAQYDKASDDLNRALFLAKESWKEDSSTSKKAQRCALLQ